MFCSACGNTISDQLNYCKNCGAKIAKDGEETPSSMLDNLLTALTFVAVGGFGILIGLVAVLLGNGVNRETVAIIAIAYLISISGICYMLLSQVPKLIDAKLKTTHETYQPPQLLAKTTAQLEEFREPVGSVTENTTRTFEKVPRSEN